MHWSLFLLDLLPLFVFVVLESVMANLRYALVGAACSIVLLVGCDLYLFGEIDQFTILSSGLVAQRSTVLFALLPAHPLVSLSLGRHGVFPEATSCWHRGFLPPIGLLAHSG